jgi:tRNA modification GTPase
MLPDHHDTIVALSSAPGPGARAIVRLSGARALAIAASAFTSADRIEPGRRRRYAGQLSLPEVTAPLPAEMYVWPPPRTYTGQELIELHTISTAPLVGALIAQCLAAGARAALPGEFTVRGFLAGKLDLTRAEAVLGVIEAGSAAELKQALVQLAGGVTRPLQELREDLLNLLADVEAGLDFADEDIHFVGTDQLLLRLGKGLALVTLLGKQLRQRSAGERPFRAVLAGPPNVGKSSLFNALAEAAALVSPEAGTTRDYLVKRVEIDGVVLELVDTAGWQGTEDTLEQQAQMLSREQQERADLVLLCVEAWERLLVSQDRLAACSTLVVGTKCDVAAGISERLATSAVTGAGLAKLRSLLAERARAHQRPALAPSLSRCQHHVDACLSHLRRAHALVLDEALPELLALELRSTLDELGAMVGAVYTDDLLDRIFSRFCIGK